jgi:hypothetical protein
MSQNLQYFAPEFQMDTRAFSALFTHSQAFDSIGVSSIPDTV